LDGDRTLGARASSFVLVHSPLVGPATWRWVAEELGGRGHAVTVPSLVEAALTGHWEGCVRKVVTEAPGGAVLVGHSGAGPLLPAIAAGMPHPPARLIFVDAAVPPASGEARLVPKEFLESLTGLAPHGVLPKWSEWFGPRAVESLIPDPHRREVVLAELPELPLGYLEGRVPMPVDWDEAGCGYVLLSEAYRADAAEAGRRGWPVIELLGAHLDLVVRPAQLAAALVELADSAGPVSRG
jgi:hypothetical protein